MTFPLDDAAAADIALNEIAEPNFSSYFLSGFASVDCCFMSRLAIREFALEATDSFVFIVGMLSKFSRLPAYFGRVFAAGVRFLRLPVEVILNGEVTNAPPVWSSAEFTSS